MTTHEAAIPNMLLKGLEEEVYTGTFDADVLPLSARIAADLPGFVTEPDARNVEYTTDPHRSYQALLDELMQKRCRLRRYLRDLGNYTLIPGSTLSLVESSDFLLSKADNPYYHYIRDTYGTSVVTASTHINIGIPDPERLIAAYRVLRAEAAMYLALTANSPFLAGQTTGAHSNRWLLFPKTPPNPPFFTSHEHFRRWVREQIELGTMFNPRHLWVSIRPNGSATPDVIERLELRICDRIAEPRTLAAVTALLEARVWQVLADPTLDPLALHSDARLQEICAANEQSAATSSLDATAIDWRTGKAVAMRDWLADCWQSCLPVAAAHGFADRLEPIGEILRHGNLAQQWLAAVQSGMAPRTVLQKAILDAAVVDQQYDPQCTAATGAPGVPTVPIVPS